jgi:hypothetical protein
VNSEVGCAEEPYADPRVACRWRSAGRRHEHYNLIRHRGGHDEQRDHVHRITVSGVPRCGTITRVRWKVAGTATTMHPRIGDEAAFTNDSYEQIFEASATSAEQVEVGDAPYCDPSRALYLRPGVNAGSDNTVTIEFLIGEGVKQ